MSLLSGITTGVGGGGSRIVIVGQEKMGKTSLVAQAPGCLLIPSEVGFGGVQVAKTPLVETFDALNTTMDEIIYYCSTGQFPYQTLAFDSATAMERLIHEKVIMTDPTNKKGANTMESAHGGYGKAYNLANQYFEDLLKKWDTLANTYGVNILLTCHTFACTVNDPTVGEFESWDILLHSPKNQKTYGKRELLTQWADVVGFLYEPLLVIADAKSDSSRAISQNRGRVMGMSRTPSYVAGNRYGVVGEIPISKENGWNEFAHAIYQSCGKDLYRR